MPRVPSYGGRAVARSPIASTRRSTAAPAGAFGGGDAAEGIDLRGPIQVAGALAQEARQRADEVATLEADNQLHQLQQSILHDETTGALRVRGKDAISASDTALEAWTKGVSSIAEGLKSERQRQAFRGRVQARRFSIDESLTSHVGRELDVWEAETAKGAITNRFNELSRSYGNPEDRARILGELQAVAQGSARRQGMAPEAAKAYLDAVTSSAHTTVLGQMLAAGDDLTAKTYYTTHKDALTGDDAAAIGKALEEGSLRGASQRQTEAIVAKHSTLKTALEATKAIADPKLRDLVNARVKEHFNEQSHIQQQESEQRFLVATNLIDGKPGVPARRVVPPSLWSQLSLGQREALDRRSKPPDEDLKNDDHTWAQFLDVVAFGPQGREAMGRLSQAEFETRYSSKFDRSHREAAVKIWASARAEIRNPKAPKDSKLTSVITINRRIGNALRESGLIHPTRTRTELKKDQAMLYIRFEEEAAQLISHEEEQSGKRLDSTRIQEIIDDLTLRYRYPEGSR